MSNGEKTDAVLPVYGSIVHAGDSFVLPMGVPRLMFVFLSEDGRREINEIDGEKDWFYTLTSIGVFSGIAQDTYHTVDARIDGAYVYRYHNNLLSISSGLTSQPQVYATVMDETGAIQFTLNAPPTPGDDSYRFRHRIGEHCARLMVEHNPASRRYLDPEQVRIEHLAHELSNEDRMAAGNVSHWARERLGALWLRNNAFRQMPYGTAVDDGLWRLERDEIDALLKPFGRSASHRLTTRANHTDMRRFLDSGVPFTFDADFTPVPVVGMGTVDAAVTRANLENFGHALDWYAEEHPDDDFNAVTRRETFSMPPATPVIPTPEGEAPIEKAQYAHYWRRQWDEAQTAGWAPELLAAYERFILQNLLISQRDASLANSAIRAVLNTNKGFTPAYVPRFSSEIQALYPPATDFWNVSFQAWMRTGLGSAPFEEAYDYLIAVPIEERFNVSLAVWLDEHRTVWLARLSAIVGRTVT